MRNNAVTAKNADPNLVMKNVRIDPDIWEESTIVAKLTRKTMQQFVADALQEKCNRIYAHRESEGIQK